MKTLYDKLHKKHKAQLNRNCILYPAMAKSVIDSLKENTSWLDLKYREVIDLLQLTTGEDTTITNVDKLFENGK
jgi:hypothetical protein